MLRILKILMQNNGHHGIIGIFEESGELEEGSYEKSR